MANDNWKQVSKYAIQREQWSIAKCFVDGATLYVLHDAKGVRYGHYESAQEAKDMADSLDLAVQA